MKLTWDVVGDKNMYETTEVRPYLQREATMKMNVKIMLFTFPSLYLWYDQIYPCDSWDKIYS